MLDMNIISISDARAKLPQLVEQISEGFERLLITVNNRPKVIVMSLDEAESLDETAEVAAIPGILKSLKKAEKEIKEGKYITLEELEKKYKLNNK